jgi:hypothetical protein
MKLFALTLLMVLQFNASASESFNFTYFGNEGSNRVFLSCHYVERAAESIMKQLGAEDVRTDCRGGIDYGMYTPVSVNVNYVLPVAANAITIKSDFNTNCFFDTKFIDQLVRSSARLERGNRATRHCFSSDSNYSYDVVIKE